MLQKSDIWTMNQRKVLFIGLVWPEPTSSAAGKRILQLVKFFAEKDFEIFFCSAASKSEASFDFASNILSDRNEVKEFSVELNNSSFDEFIQKINPDFVVYDRFISEEQFGWRVSRHCPDAVQILDTEDLHFLRTAREKAHKNKEEINLYNEVTIREIASILRCDLSLIISEFEMNLLRDEFRISNEVIHYLPFLEDLSEINPDEFKSFEERKDFVFIGNFIHEPNWQTVLHLKKNIWPKIKHKLPEANLNIYGAYPSQKVFELDNAKEGFLVRGRAENALKEISGSRVLLAPITFGAGQKGKFIDAMLTGTPVASNSIGAESMFEELIPGIVEDDENQFIEKTVELYRNKNLWINASQTGFKILSSKFDRNSFEENLHERLMSLESDLREARKRNFAGQILKSNYANALKYMSLWIEQKNK